MSNDATKNSRSSKPNVRDEQNDSHGDTGARAKAFPSTEPNNVALGINAKDDVDVAIAWLANGKIDGKHFAKKLPHTVKDVRDGTIAADTFLPSMYRALYKSQLRVRVSDNFQGTHVDLLVYRLTAKVLPEMYCRNDQQKQWLVDHARPQFASDFLSHLEDSGTCTRLYSNDLYTYVGITPPILEALCATCDEWATQIDEILFKGRDGTFHCFCRKFYEPMDVQGDWDFSAMERYCDDERVVLIRGILQEASDDTYWEEKRRLDIRKHLLRQAVSTVTKGHHEALKTCWECQKMVPLKKCSGCQVARYCGRDCQRKAFKGGHKNKCELLKAKHDAFLNDLHKIDQAYENGGTVDGIKLNVQIDYEVSMNFTFNPSPFPQLVAVVGQDGTELENTFPIVAGPSIHFFYENLSRVLKKEWWIYENPVSLEQYREELKGEEEIVLSNSKWGAKDERYFDCLCICLSYDIVGFADDLPEEHRENLVVALPELSPLLKKVRDDVGFSMPAERFVELYKVRHEAQDLGEEITRGRIKSYHKAIAFQSFRDVFHK